MVASRVPPLGDDSKCLSPEAQEFRAAWLTMMESMKRWVMDSNPSPDVVLAEMEHLTTMMRQVKASGRVMAQ